MYENFRTFSLEKLIRFYEQRGKAFMQAKDILEKDRSYIGKEYEQKIIIIDLLEETAPHMKSAKKYYDEEKNNLSKDEIQIVFRRLRRVKEEIKSFPYRPACLVEEIIIQESAKINDLFQYVVSV